MSVPAQIQICTAVLMEAQYIARGLSLRRVGPLAWADGEVRLTNIGIGAFRLAELEAEWKVARPEVLIMAGLAGALDPALKVGDLVTEESRMWTAAGIVSTPEEKATLFRETACAAVDMETRIVREFAAARGIRFAVVRAISDRADESVSAQVGKVIDRDGRPRAGKLASAMLRNPLLIKELSRLGKSSRVACARLQTAVAAEVERWRKTLKEAGKTS